MSVITYFISYNYTAVQADRHINGFGNCEVKRDSHIEDYDDIMELQRKMNTQDGFLGKNITDSKVIIINYKQLL